MKDGVGMWDLENAEQRRAEARAEDRFDRERALERVAEHGPGTFLLPAEQRTASQAAHLDAARMPLLATLLAARDALREGETLEAERHVAEAIDIVNGVISTGGDLPVSLADFEPGFKPAASDSEPF